jgi:peptide/nickel transport system substrate-binding protein
VNGNGSKDYDRVDIAGAKILLAQAGLVRPEVCILFDPSNPRRVAEFSAIQKSAALAGFLVTDCSSTDWRQLLGTDGAYDASLYALRPTSLAVTAVAASFRSDSTINNLNFYADPAVDALIDRLDATFDGNEQIAILKKIDTLVWADGYGVPLYQFPSVTASDDRVTGISPSPFSPNLLWNIWDWAPVKSK